MSSRHWIIAPVAAAGIALAAPALAQGMGGQRSGSPWFVGVTAGRTTFDGIDQLANRANQSLDGAPHNVSWGTHGDGFGFLFGYHMNRYLAFDLEYTNFGSTDGSYKTTTAAPGVPLSSGSFQLAGWAMSLGAIGSIPFTRSFSAYGRIGLARDHMKAGTSGRGPQSLPDRTYDSYDWIGVYGAGLKYAFTPAIAGKLGYRIYNNAGSDNTGGSANVKYLYLGVDFGF